MRTRRWWIATGVGVLAAGLIAASLAMSTDRPTRHPTPSANASPRADAEPGVGGGPGPSPRAVAGAIADATVLRGSVEQPSQAALLAHFPTSVAFSTDADGLMATDAGLVERTSDGARSWSTVGHVAGLEHLDAVSTRVAYGVRSALNIDVLDADHWWIAANDCAPHAPVTASCGGALLRTADAGVHWQLIRLPTVLGASTLSFATPEDGYADISSSGIYRTTDGGLRWRLVPSLAQ